MKPAGITAHILGSSPTHCSWRTPWCSGGAVDNAITTFEWSTVLCSSCRLAAISTSTALLLQRSRLGGVHAHVFASFSRGHVLCVSKDAGYRSLMEFLTEKAAFLTWTSHKWTLEWPLLTIRKSWITRAPARFTAPWGGTRANPSIFHLPTGCSIVRASSPASLLSCSRPGTHLSWENDESIGILRWDQSRMKLIAKSHDWKKKSDLFLYHEGAKAKQELSVISTQISLGVRADYLFYFEMPGCHGCFILQNHNYVSLTLPLAMPRLMMCAQVTITSPRSSTISTCNETIPTGSGLDGCVQ